jgi:urease accessory protein
MDHRGSYGALELGFRLGRDGRTILHHLHRRVPLIVQQALYFDESLPDMPCIYILSSGGPTVEGDRFSVEVELEHGAMAHISTGAATLITSMEQDSAELRQSITLHPGSYLEWLPRPIIPAASSRYRSSTEIVAAPTASLFWSEVVACGRLHSGERFDYDTLDLGTTIYSPERELVLCERLILEPARLSPCDYALLGPFTHFSTAIILTPKEATDRLYRTLWPQTGEHLQVSIARLSESRGLVVRGAAMGSEPLLRLSRELCSMVRREVKGVALPEEFPWR